MDQALKQLCNLPFQNSNLNLSELKYYEQMRCYSRHVIHPFRTAVLMALR